MRKTLNILKDARAELINRRKELAELLEKNKNAEASLIEEWTTERTFCRKISNELDSSIKQYERKIDKVIVSKIKNRQ